MLWMPLRLLRPSESQINLLRPVPRLSLTSLVFLLSCLLLHVYLDDHALLHPIALQSATCPAPYLTLTPRTLHSLYHIYTDSLHEYNELVFFPLHPHTRRYLPSYAPVSYRTLELPTLTSTFASRIFYSRNLRPPRTVETLHLDIECITHHFDTTLNTLLHLLHHYKALTHHLMLYLSPPSLLPPSLSPPSLSPPSLSPPFLSPPSLSPPSLSPPSQSPSFLPDEVTINSALLSPLRC